MILLAVALFAIFGLLTTLGLASFHLMALLSKSKKLYIFILPSILISIGLFGIGSQFYVSPYEKHLILYTILLNHLLLLGLIVKLIKNKEDYFPKEKVKLKRHNTFTLVFYGITILVYLFFSYSVGIQVGWEAMS